MITWNRIQSVYEPTAERHAKAVQLLGLNVPPAVFSALFHARHADPDLERRLRGLDFSQVTWIETERSGVALRQVFVDRTLQSAVDEAYRDLLDEDFIHERADVIASWRSQGTWIEPPILLSGELLGSAVREALLVGATRLGCLLALLDQGVIAETAKHAVWVGRAR